VTAVNAQMVEKGLTGLPEVGERAFDAGRVVMLETGVISLAAIAALIAGVLPSLPGFLEEVKLLPAGSVPHALAELYHYAWFVGFAVAFVTYLVGRRLAPR
jgi:nucleobase:cation symporter-1, NCS1 family